jgi:hypothetical protein
MKTDSSIPKRNSKGLDVVRHIPSAKLEDAEQAKQAVLLGNDLGHPMNFHDHTPIFAFNSRMDSAKPS